MRRIRQGPPGPAGETGPSGPPGSGGVVDVTSFGVVGNGTTDDTVAIQAAIDATQGRRLRFPRGKYRVTSTLHLTTRNHWLQGELADRNVTLGTEIAYEGTGSCFEIGSDNGQPLDGSFYDGPQGQVFESLWINHTSRDTALNLTGSAAGIAFYKAGSYGIRDHRAGHVVLNRCGIEGFEYNVWAVQSDFNRFYEVTCAYSLYGIYLGPRSDQNNISGLYAFYCERAVTVDRATQVNLYGSHVVLCGTTTVAPIEIRKGSAGVNIYGAWLENADGAAVTDLRGWIGAGLVDGYGPGGVGTTTTAVQGINVEDPIFYTNNIGVGGHCRTIIALGAATGVRLYNPLPRTPATFASLNALIEAPSGTSFSGTDSQCALYGVANTVATPFLNSGSGSPDCHVRLEQIDTNLTIKSADYTVKITDVIVILSNAAAAPRTFTLPNPQRDGQEVKFCNASGTHNLTIARSGGKTINEVAANLTLTPGQHVTLFFVTTQGSWYTIG